MYQRAYTCDGREWQKKCLRYYYQVERPERRWRVAVCAVWCRLRLLQFRLGLRLGAGAPHYAPITKRERSRRIYRYG